MTKNSLSQLRLECRRPALGVPAAWCSGHGLLMPVGLGAQGMGFSVVQFLSTDTLRCP